MQQKGLLMAKKLTLQVPQQDGSDKEYVLEFTRSSVRQMEENGFVAQDIVTKPMLTLPQLFAGAFLAHHRFVKQAEIDRIYDKIPNKSDFLARLAEMYNEPLEALMAEPDKDAEGNVNWGASW